jgi:two-component system sensor histidine kinase VanS
VLLRVAVLAGGCAALAYLAQPLVKDYLDGIYRRTESPSWQWLFYFFSENREVLIFGGVLLLVIPLAGWIFRPFFKEYTDLIRTGLRPDAAGPDGKVTLPRRLKSLETVLNEVGAELRLSRYAAREAEQRKDELVVYLAHDIRTPLTSVLGYLELLGENPDLSEAQREKFTRSALNKAERIRLLVEELFEVTRYSLTDLELDKTPVNLSVMLNQLAEESRPLFERREITVDLFLEDLPPVSADADKLARALDNVLHNAAHYTPPGGMVAVMLDSPADRARIRLSNTGADIPPEKLARFFEKFYRGEEARQTATGGSGLGLAIAKNIIEAHGGQITAENKDGLTTFTIRL